METSKDVVQVLHQSLLISLYVFNSQTSSSFEKFKKNFIFFPSSFLLFPLPPSVPSYIV